MLSDKVICMICKKEMKHITCHHLKSHNITLKEYKQKYPNYSLISDSARKNKAKGGRACQKKHPNLAKENFGRGRITIMTKYTKEERSQWARENNAKQKRENPEKYYADRKIAMDLGRESYFKRLKEDPEYYKKISENASKRNKKRNREDPERWKKVYRDMGIKGYKACKKFNSSIEKHTKLVLNKLYQNEWIHNIKHPLLIINHKIPDFRHISLPIVIEVNGDYWHSRYKTGISKDEHEKEQVNHYNQQGYNCLVFWEHEVNGMNFEQLLIERISSLFIKIEDNDKIQKGKLTKIDGWIKK